ncbi:MAG TPA: hypothetical protein VEK38_02895, partial [Candidatus Bathyarchaeia archaeon]|nr:hypothetical protein [Candidatus Bathyarchaeia archaeon]
NTGIYYIEYYVLSSSQSAGQFELFLDSGSGPTALVGTTYAAFNGASTVPIVGYVIVAINAGSILTLENITPAIIITTPNGSGAGTATGVSASVSIMQLA